MEKARVFNTRAAREYLSAVPQPTQATNREVSGILHCDSFELQWAEEMELYARAANMLGPEVVAGLEIDAQDIVTLTAIIEDQQEVPDDPEEVCIGRISHQLAKILYPEAVGNNFILARDSGAPGEPRLLLQVGIYNDDCLHRLPCFVSDTESKVADSITYTLTGDTETMVDRLLSISLDWL